MAKFYGKVGFLRIEKTAPDVYGEILTERLYKGDVIRNQKRYQSSESLNDDVVLSKGGISIYWTNSNINKGVNIAIILQYGHGTRNGGYVQGRDYINPALRPIFDAMADGMWKEVTSL